MDEVIFEKDGTISKMKQFDYKIHKYKPGKTIMPEGSLERGRSPRSKRRKAVTPEGQEEE